MKKVASCQLSVVSDELPPIIEGPGYTLYRGDCLDVLPTLAAGSVDAVVCDPPYEANLNPTLTAWDKFPSVAAWRAIGRTISSAGVASWMASPTVGFRHVPSVEENLRIPLKETIVWIHGNGRPINATRPKRCFDQIWIHSKSGKFPGTLPLMEFSSKNSFIQQRGVTRNLLAGVDGKRRWEPGIYHPANVAMMTDHEDPEDYSRIFAIKRVNNKKVERHPTEKPVDLMAYLVGLTSPIGASVLDPFMGSGTTGEACLRTGRRFIGIESDPHWFAVAAQRLADTAAELNQEKNT